MSTDTNAPSPGHRPPADVVFRDLDESDIPAVEDLYRSMNEHDAYMRFFGARPKHLHTVAAYTCRRLEGSYALGAFRGERLLGIANYIRGPRPQTRPHPDVEIAITVDHSVQARGIGTGLLEHLVAHARSAGIRWLTAEILAENSLMIGVLRDIGLTHELHLDGTTMTLEIDLHAGDLDDSACV
ncbi:N-acetyltransferase [Williamsia sp. 1138]|uniref:GNAT family N-acetyltransferase n=1 Tax=Williamsia sp. 1138 TaxID=1903117 RepID=UPI000A0F478F|nr:GNAT family N-acetyltransferase [Williamsia sp. 1138]OZG29537.1 N-acetyltransferase [Williamsia sp. 1138]